MEVPSTSPIRVILLVLVVVIMGGGAYYAWTQFSDSGPDLPDSWDARVVEQVEFVQSERGRDFLYPIHIDFLADEEFARSIGATTDALTAGDRVHVERALDILRSLALISESAASPLTADDVIADVLDSGALARYRPFDERISVRGTGIDTLNEVALINELTVALHDQHFGGARVSRVDRSPAAVGRRAVSAGAAAVIERQHLETMSDAEQRAYRNATLSPNESEPADLVRALTGLAEVLGVPLVEVAVADATPADATGPSFAQVNVLMTRPPRTELELLQPWATVDGFERIAIAAPEPLDDEEVIARGDFGAASLYLVFGLRVDPRDALAASLVWAADSYLLTSQEFGGTCIQIAVAGRDGDASDLFEEVMRDFVASGPREAQATVTRNERVVTLRSCDPGPRAATGIELDPDSVLSVPASRTALLAELRSEGASRAKAVCVADLVLAGLPVTEPPDPDRPPEADTLYQNLLDDSKRSCRRL